MSRPLTATIDQRALRANLGRVRELAAQSRIWAVVKADAYGHGLARAAPGLTECDGYALVEFDKALQLRSSYPQMPILMLEGAFDARSTALAIEHNLSLAVHEPAQIAWLEEHSGPRTLDIWIKFNSGMNRLGFSQASFRHAYESLVSAAPVKSIGMMTHFADAESEGGIEEPMVRFERACRGLPGKRSLANSAACFDSRSHADWVRPGIMLYGATPFEHRSAKALRLKPVMHLESQIIAVQTLLPGDALGYGGTFKAGRPMRVGVVACGYGDGYPRSAPTGTPVWVGNRRTRTVGRVSMDMLTVDLDPVADAGVGTPVQLWGDHVSVDEVAHAAGTIGYELLCRLAPRVPVSVIKVDG